MNTSLVCKNTKYVPNIVCPYCESRTLKLIPIEDDFKEFYQDSVFCTECGRHFVNLLKQPEEKLIA
jgi:DNA-directed RNA polymerase subunit RPC12/RpoP